MITGLSTLVPRDGSSSLPDLRRAPLVTMVEPAQHRPDSGGWIGRGAGLSFSNAKWVRFRMIIFQESLQVPVQASLVEGDEMMQAFATNRTDQPLDIRSRVSLRGPRPSARLLPFDSAAGGRVEAMGPRPSSRLLERTAAGEVGSSEKPSSMS